MRLYLIIVFILTNFVLSACSTPGDGIVYPSEEQKEQWRKTHYPFITYPIAGGPPTWRYRIEIGSPLNSIKLQKGETITINVPCLQSAEVYGKAATPELGAWRVKETKVRRQGYVIFEVTQTVTIPYGLIIFDGFSITAPSALPGPPCMGRYNQKLWMDKNECILTMR